MQTLRTERVAARLAVTVARMLQLGRSLCPPNDLAVYSSAGSLPAYALAVCSSAGSLPATALSAGVVHSLVIEKKIPPMALCAGL